MLFGEIPFARRWAVNGKFGGFYSRAKITSFTLPSYDTDYTIGTSATSLPPIPPGLLGAYVSAGLFNFQPSGSSSPDVITYIITGPGRSQDRAFAGSNFSKRESNLEVNFSVGLTYKISARYTAHLDYQQFNNIADSDIEALSISLAIRF